MKILRLSLLTAAIALLLPATALAHGAIFTYQHLDGDNLVMITHNVNEPLSGAQITYNLRLYNVDGQPVGFQNVDATVQKDTQRIAQQTLQVSDNQDANFTFTYPSEGNYLLKFSFLDNDKTVAKGEFPITVGKGYHESVFGSIFTPTTAVAFLAGAATLKLFSRREQILSTMRAKLKAKTSSRPRR